MAAEHCVNSFNTMDNYESVETSELPSIDHPFKNRMKYSSIWVSPRVMIASEAWHNFPYIEMLLIESPSLYWLKRWIPTETQLDTTYVSAQVVTPAECELTQASHNHQNPAQILQSPQAHPHWAKSCDAHAGSALRRQNLFGHWCDVLVHSDPCHASYQRTQAPGSPVPQRLSSPRSVPPSIPPSPNGHTSHPGLNQALLRLGHYYEKPGSN